MFDALVLLLGYQSFVWVYFLYSFDNVSKGVYAMIKRIRKKLSNQISFYIILGVVLVFSAMASTTFISARDLLMSRIENETLVKTESATQYVWNIFENAMIITEQMSFNNEIRQYLKEVETRDDVTSNPLYPKVLETIENIKNSYDLNFLAWVANEKANFYLDSTNTIPDDTYDVTIRPWYKIAVENSGVAYTDPYIEWGTGQIVMSSIKALRDNNQIYGFVVVDMQLDSIPSIISSIDVGKEGMIFLVNEKGAYIYNENKDMMMEHGIYEAEDPLSPFSNEIMRGLTGFKEINYNGKDYYMSYRPASNTGWALITLISRNEALSEMYYFTMKILSILIAGIGILLFIIYFTVKNVTSPVRAITTFGKEIAQGNLDASLPFEYTKRDDEMGDLSRTFITITEVFRQHSALLEHDIEKKEEEIKLQYRYIIENEKLATLGTLVAGVAHEINTPLGVGLTSASYIEKLSNNQRELLDSGNIKKSEVYNFMDELDKANSLLVNNLGRAADLVTSFKQIAVNQSTEIRDTFNLSSNIETVILSLKHEYKNRPIKIINNCDNSIILDSYPGPLSQIFTNFIMNSLSHGYKDDEGGEIIIDAVKNEGNITLTYHDDGRGIDKMHLDHIFDPFFTTNRINGNSGLGMYIVHNIVSQLLMGTIVCESSLNNGVKFTIVIPEKLG